MSAGLEPIPGTQVRATPEALLEREKVADESVTGIVLAGGRSRRMGRDKAFIELAGRPLIQWVLDAVEAVSDKQLIVARDARGLEGFGPSVVTDQLPARGPLTGLHAGLKAAETDLCLVVACDLPLVRSDLLVLLRRAVGPMHAAIPYLGEGPIPEPGQFATAREAGLQPLLAAYRRRCIQPLEKLLLEGSMPTNALISMIKTRIVGPEEWGAVDPHGRSFFNVNAPDDLEEAIRLLNTPD